MPKEVHREDSAHPSAPAREEEDLILLAEEPAAAAAGTPIFEEPSAPPPTAGNGGKPPKDPPLIALGGEDEGEDSDDTAFDRTFETVLGGEPTEEVAPLGDLFTEAPNADSGLELVGAGMAAEGEQRSRFEPVAIVCSLVSIGSLLTGLGIVITHMPGGVL